MIFSDELTSWYHKNKRSLPWRDTTDAYVIWLSEIILQQTRVEQGLPYFYRFLERYPDVKAFAAATEDEILKLWQGLGYYSRGRNMLKTARQVVSEYQGVFPVRYEQLIKLKGIGEYTAAAISSFSSNEARAVVDGNVYRVLARYFGIEEPINSSPGKKIFQQLADEVLDSENAGSHNQALMEFGAMLCKPKNPDCGICPLRLSCLAYQNDKVTSLPVKLRKIRIKERYLNYFLISEGNTILMSKRGDKDIWANMYDLPLLETSGPLPAISVISRQEVKDLFGDDIVLVKSETAKKHVLTHQHIYAQFIMIDVPADFKHPEKLNRVDLADLEKIAMPKIIYTFLNNFFNT